MLLDLTMIQENYNSWQISTAYDWLISSAAVGVGSTETYIYFSRGDGGNGTLLPSVSEIRASEWTLQSYVNTQAGPTIHTGVQDDDIWKSTKSLRPGMKLKTTLSVLLNFITGVLDMVAQLV